LLGMQCIGGRTTWALQNRSNLARNALRRLRAGGIYPGKSVHSRGLAKRAFAGFKGEVEFVLDSAQTVTETFLSRATMKPR